MDENNQVESAAPINKIHVVTLQDNLGDQYTFFPVSDMTNFVNLLLKMVDTSALELAMTHTHIAPEAEHVNFIKETVKTHVDAGNLRPDTAAKIDPQFQARYELNFQNLVSTIVENARGKVEAFYDTQNVIKKPGDPGFNGGLIKGR